MKGGRDKTHEREREREENIETSKRGRGSEEAGKVEMLCEEGRENRVKEREGNRL